MFHYSRSLLLVSFILSGVFSACAQTPTGQSREFSGLHEVEGEATNGLQPRIFITHSRTDWHIDITYIAQTNFANYAWLNVSNRVGSKLQLCLTNGMEVPPKSPDAFGALYLPATTTVSNVMAGSWIPRRQRAAQWLMHWGAKIGESEQAVTFSLRNAFGDSVTNDVVLQIAPIIYRVDADRTTAHLVEFPGIKINLKSDGKIEKLK